MFIYEPTDLLNFCFVEVGGGALLQQIHILLPLTRVTQFKNVNERLLKSLEVEMKKKNNSRKLRSSVCCGESCFQKGRLEKRQRGQLLGGTHLSLVTKRLHEKYLHNPHFARTMCKIYVGISDKQAVYLNSNACITILFVQRMHMRGCANMHQRLP